MSSFKNTGWLNGAFLCSALLTLLTGCGRGNDADEVGASSSAEKNRSNPTQDGDASKKVTICHIPPGNPPNAHTITVGEPAVRAHLAHGDHLGPCAGGPGP